MDSVQGQTKTKVLHARGDGQRPRSAKNYSSPLIGAPGQRPKVSQRLKSSTDRGTGPGQPTFHTKTKDLHAGAPDLPMSKVSQRLKSSTNRGTRTVSQGQTKTKDLHKGAPDSVQGQTKAKVLQTRGNGQCPKVSQRQKSSVRSTWRINIVYCLSGTS